MEIKKEQNVRLPIQENIIVCTRPMFVDKLYIAFNILRECVLIYLFRERKKYEKINVMYNYKYNLHHMIV